MPIDPEYARALGHAVYTFTLLEWNAVYCCERIEEGFVHGVDGKKSMTSRNIAEKLVSLCKRLPDSVDARELRSAADEFLRLVEDRNGLVHARPGTAPDGHSQRLFRHGKMWSIEQIEEQADAFAACSIRLNRLFHGFLSGEHGKDTNE